jgi:hypothetical protein
MLLTPYEIGEDFEIALIKAVERTGKVQVRGRKGGEKR